MPLEIRELHIKVNLGEPAPDRPGAGPAAPPAQESTGEEGRDQLLARCVDEVLRLLRDRKER